MDNEELVAGVSPGGFKDVYEVRILICYLLNSISQPLSNEQLNYIFSENHLVNYFTFSSAIAQLIESKHVVVEHRDGDDFYILQEEGVETALVLQKSIPRSVREKVVSSAIDLLAQIKKERENEVNIEACNNGYIVKFTIHDNDFDLIKLELYVPDKQQAKQVRTNFLKDPAKFYSKMVQMLIDNDDDN